MKSRLELSKKLHELADHVYYQPTTGTKIEYPCIIYNLSAGADTFADNRLYLYTKSYTITVIDKDPDSEIPDKVRQAFQMCSYDRHFVSSNLHHDVFQIYF